MPDYTSRTFKIKRDQITPGKNDRTIFNPAELQALADNIATNGLLQPIMVRPVGGDRYEIILGERRYRACSLLGWDKIPCIVRDVTEEEASAGMLSENMVRSNLDAIDEAVAYQSRIDRFGWSVDYTAQVAGVTPIRVMFRLKLLRLRADLQALVRSGNLALGYAQILADAGLDANFQSLAVDRLREASSPTPAWFRKEVSALLTLQAQQTMFDVLESPELYSQPAPAQVDPPLPSTTIPPTCAGTPREIMAAHISFWQAAGDAWAALGKSFKRQECIAAARALETVLALI